MSIKLKHQEIERVSDISGSHIGIFYNKIPNDSLMAKFSDGSTKSFSLEKETYYFNKSITNLDANYYFYCGNIYLPDGILSLSSSCYFGAYEGTGTTKTQLINSASNVITEWSVSGFVQSSSLDSNVNISEGWYSVRIKNDLGISIFKSIIFIFE